MRNDAGARWSLTPLLAFTLALLLAAMQILIWVKAVEARGGPEVYVRGIDFMPTIAGGVAIRGGQGAELYDFDTQLAIQRQVRAPYLTLAAEQLLPYNHLPFEALVLVPFLDLPYAVLYGGITLLSLIAVAVSCWLLYREAPIDGVPLLVMIAAVCSYHPLYQALWLGQTSAFILLGICGTYAALKRRREYWAAAPLLLVALKPQVILVVGLLLLLCGHWRTLIAAAGTLAVGSVVVMPILGVMWPLHYANLLSAIATWANPNVVNPASMPTIRGLMVNLLAHSSPSLALFCTSALSLLVLALVVWCWWRVRAAMPHRVAASVVRTRHYDWLWALTSLVAALVPAHMGLHDHLLLLLPAWILVRYAISGGWGRGYAALWFALLWGGYAVALLAPFVEETPAVSVVPNVLLLLVMTVLLVRHVVTSSAHASASREVALLPEPVV